MSDKEFSELAALKPRYGQLTVSDDLLLRFDQDDSWIAIRDISSYECDCIMIGYSEIDQLIAKLTEAKGMIKSG